MENKLFLVLKSLENISEQIPELSKSNINGSLLLNGENSLFDSFSILLLLVEIENVIGIEISKHESIVEWYLNLNLTEKDKLSLEDFTKLLSKEFFEE